MTINATPATFSTRGLSLGLKKFHRWASAQQKDECRLGFIPVYGPANGAFSPWRDKLPTVDQIMLTVEYNPMTGMFNIHVQGRNANDTVIATLSDGREIPYNDYPHQMREAISIHELPSGAKGFLLKLI